MTRTVVYVAGVTHPDFHQGAERLARVIGAVLGERVNGENNRDTEIVFDYGAADPKRLGEDVTVEGTSIMIRAARRAELDPTSKPEEDPAYRDVIELLEVNYQPYLAGVLSGLGPFSRFWARCLVLWSSIAPWFALGSRGRMIVLPGRQRRLVRQLRVLAAAAFFIMAGEIAIALWSDLDAARGLQEKATDLSNSIIGTPSSPQEVTIIDGAGGDGTEVSKGGEPSWLESIWKYLAANPLLVLIAVGFVFYGLMVLVMKRLEATIEELSAATRYMRSFKEAGAVTPAIREAIRSAYSRDGSEIDLLAFSMGAVFAADAILPRNDDPERGRAWPGIADWVTIGFPYSIIRSRFPRYWDDKVEQAIEFERWINLSRNDDALATVFTAGDGLPMRGLRRGPDMPVKIDLDASLRRRLSAHQEYWNPDAPGSKNVIEALVENTDHPWVMAVMSALDAPPAREPATKT